MLKLEYSPLVLEKLKTLKEETLQYGNTADGLKDFTKMLEYITTLQESPRLGVDIRNRYGIETHYWYLFTHRHYFVYRFDEETVSIIQMFHEQEDFILQLFGVSGRTQESKDYWGE